MLRRYVRGTTGTKCVLCDLKIPPHGEYFVIRTDGGAGPERHHCRPCAAHEMGGDFV